MVNPSKLFSTLDYATLAFKPKLTTLFADELTFFYHRVDLMNRRRYKMAFFLSTAQSSQFQETLSGSCLCDCLTKRLRQVGYVGDVNSCVGCLT